MKAMKVVDFFSHMVSKLEPEHTFKLVGIEFSPKHGHEVCVMQLVGRNAFPKFTPEELLSNPKSMVGLSPQDAIAISKLDQIIKERKSKCRVLEIDKNGTIVLADASGKTKRYAEKLISSDRQLIKSLNSEDAHDLGYRVGFRDGVSTRKVKRHAAQTFKSKLMNIIPLIRDKGSS